MFKNTEFAEQYNLITRSYATVDLVRLHLFPVGGLHAQSIKGKSTEKKKKNNQREKTFNKNKTQ